MLKFFVHGSAESPPVVGLCLTAQNLELLKQDKPITFDLAEEGFPLDGRVIITYNSPKFREIESRLREQAERSSTACYVFVITDEVCDKLMQDKDGMLIRVKNLSFLLVYGETAETLYERFQGFIGPETRCVNKGFAPGEGMSWNQN